MNKEFKLPDVGEGLTETDIVSWHVKPGDTVTINQVLVEIETAKAVVELPSPYAGTVSALLADEGATVDVGTPIITIDVPVAGAAPPPNDGPPRPPSRSSSATASSQARPAAVRARPPRPVPAPTPLPPRPRLTAARPPGGGPFPPPPPPFSPGATKTPKA